MKINTQSFLTITVLFFLSISSNLFGQSVGIGTDTPNDNAVLELVVDDPISKPQGLLLPKLTTVQRVSLGGVLTSADNGMIVFDVTENEVFHWDGTSWVMVRAGDNLGSHEAVQNIKLSGFTISNDGGAGEGLAFDDAGNGSIGGVVNSSYKLYVYGKIKSDGITEMSDRRLKKDVEKLEGALEKILKLRGVSYNWRQDNEVGVDFEKELQIGLIAQEVEEVLPELVDTDDQGYKSVEYSKLVSVLIEGMKEQQKQIALLKSELEGISQIVGQEKTMSVKASVGVVK